jgi:hypothetical protein
MLLAGLALVFQPAPSLHNKDWFAEPAESLEKPRLRPGGEGGAQHIHQPGVPCADSRADRLHEPADSLRKKNTLARPGGKGAFSKRGGLPLACFCWTASGSSSPSGATAKANQGHPQRPQAGNGQVRGLREREQRPQRWLAPGADQVLIQDAVVVSCR